MKRLQSILYLGLFCCLFTACEPEEPEVINEEEVITTLNYTLTSEDGSTVVLSFQDLDGDGGNAPVISEGTLEANTNYSGSLELLNEQTDPVDNITNEIIEEAEDHQFFFQSTVTDLNFTYNDQDTNDNPIGLMTNLSTGEVGSGTITITLRHKPSKSANLGIDDLSNAGGETDIEVSFNVDVQ